MGICYLFFWEHQALVVNAGKTQIKVYLSLFFFLQSAIFIYFKLSKAESDALY